MFSYRKNKTADFLEAQENCKSLGKTLAHVKSLDDWNKLTDYKDGDVQYGYWWLGAEKEEASEEYFWSDGTQYQQFDPAVKISQNGIGKRCLALYTHTPRNIVRLFSLPCDRHLYYICQDQVENIKDITATVSQTLLHQPNTGEGASVTDLRGLYSSANSESTKWATVMQQTTRDDYFSPGYYDKEGTEMGNMIWMFVSLILGLLLVISIVYIAKLRVDLKRMKKPGQHRTMPNSQIQIQAV